MTPSSLKRVLSTDRDISPPPAKRRVAATTTTKAVANFFKPASEKEPEKITFHTLNETLFVARYDNASTTPRAKPVKIAAFDFDDTLVTTKSGTKFAKTAQDWQWWHTSVPGRLKQLHAEGYAIVVLSNQAAVSLRSDPKTPKEGMKSVANFKGRVSAVLTALDLPISVYAATEKDLYRKPRTGMWTQLLSDYGLSGANDVDREKCVFVGDAAGREGDVARKVRKDHSCSDRDLAANIGIPFQMPEEFFLGEEPQPFVRAFDPVAYLAAAAQTPAAPSPTFTKTNALDIIILCGSPGAGKSTYYWQTLEPLGYARVNQDLLKTRGRCLKTATQYLEDGTSVVVDNTNADVETRGAWIALARKFAVPIRTVHFTAPVRVCEHNDTVRALGGEATNPEHRTLLPKMAFTGFAARYRPPKVEEGFQDVVEVGFAFRGTEAERAVWRRYWVS